MTNEELVLAYQNGDRMALDKLVELNKGIVSKLANRFYTERTNSIDKEDLIQEGYICLITAADRYKADLENSCKFITYAVYWIYQKINRFVNTKNTNEEISLNTPAGEEGDTELIDYIEGVDYSFENLEDKLYYKQLRKELEEAMNRYNTLREREILKLHYGWDGNKCLSYSELAEIYDVSKTRIMDIEHLAARKIRRSSWGSTKAKELYIQKRKIAAYSFEKTIDSISFAQRYLEDVM